MYFNDPLADLHNYNSGMTISQVVKFFSRNNITFTNTMIQNYVRVGVLEPPGGRIYHEAHMKALVMIEHLKPVFSLEEIRKLFDTIDPSQCYDEFMDIYYNSAKSWTERADEVSVLELAAACAASKHAALDRMAE